MDVKICRLFTQGNFKEIRNITEVREVSKWEKSILLIVLLRI